MISDDLLKIIACPKCKGPLKLRGSDQLICQACMVKYPIEDDIPILLIEKAVKLDPEKEKS